MNKIRICEIAILSTSELHPKGLLAFSDEVNLHMAERQADQEVEPPKFTWLMQSHRLMCIIEWWWAADEDYVTGKDDEDDE